MRRKPDGTRIAGRKPGETRIVGREPEGSPEVGRRRGTADASRRCAPVELTTRNRSEPEGWPPVALECKPRTQV